MIDLESQLNLREDSEAVVELLWQYGGAVACSFNDRGTYWLVLRPRTAPAEQFVARVVWSRYPHDPPSVKFATAINGSVSSTNAWPLIDGYRPGSFDICQPFTSEAFAVHPEWRRSAEQWRSTGNPFLWVADILQRDLNTRYQGRSG